MVPSMNIQRKLFCSGLFLLQIRWLNELLDAHPLGWHQIGVDSSSFFFFFSATFIYLWASFFSFWFVRCSVLCFVSFQFSNKNISHSSNSADYFSASPVPLHESVNVKPGSFQVSHACVSMNEREKERESTNENGHQKLIQIKSISVEGVSFFDVWIRKNI